MEIFSPVGKGTHDGEEFAVVNVVVSFDIAKGFEEKATGCHSLFCSWERTAPVA